MDADVSGEQLIVMMVGWKQRRREGEKVGEVAIYVLYVNRTTLTREAGFLEEQHTSKATRLVLLPAKVKRAWWRISA